MDRTPELVRGPAFHLDGDGRWDVQELPYTVLRDAEYSGELKIEGSPAVVFQTPDGDQWAQKAPGEPSPKGEEAVEDALAQVAARIAGVHSPSFSDPFLEMGKRVIAKVDLERNQIMSAQALLDELRSCREALDKAVRHSRALSTDSSLEWVLEALEAKKEELDGLSQGIRESIEYITRMDMG